MKNPLNASEWSVGSVVLALWVVFSLVYIGSSIRENVVQRVYNAGAQAAVVQAMQLAQSCQPVVLQAGDVRVNLMNTQCQQAASVGTVDTATEGDDAADDQ